MTVLVGDKVASVPTKTGSVAVSVGSPAIGDTVVSIPTKTGQTLAKVSTVSVGDKCLFVPDSRGKYIAIKTYQEPPQMRIMIPSGYNLSYRSDGGVTWTPQAYTAGELTSLVYAGGGVAYACDSTVSSAIYKSTDYGVTWSLFVEASNFCGNTYNNCLKLMEDGNLCIIVSGPVPPWTPFAEGDYIYTVNTTTAAVALRFTPDPSVDWRWLDPSLVVGADGVLVAVMSIWSSRFTGTGNYFGMKIMRSADNGVSWQEVYRSTETLYEHHTPLKEAAYIGGGRFIVVMRRIEVDPPISKENNATLRSSDNGASWAYGPDLPSPSVYPTIVGMCSPNSRPNVVIAQVRKADNSEQYFIRSINNGVSWEIVYTVAGGGNWSFYYIGGNNILAYGYGDTPLYLSTDTGITWAPLDETRPVGGCCALIW